jgi:LDH2 family malate/lactate/ureidoglycolate dehydrogenase
MLPTYETKWAAGGLRLDAEPHIVHDDGRAGVVLDGRAGLGHITAADAMEIACHRATTFGIGTTVVRNSHHFGAAGYYARQAAERGLLGIVTTSARTLTQAPVGGTERRLGTNPLAFAAPSAGHEPFVLDMSTTVVAVNKVKTYALAGRDLPADWVADGNGTPVRAADQALDVIRNQDVGGLVPLGGPSTLTGGHKGYGLAMMVQILSCALSGAGLPGGGPPDDIGHMLVAIDPTAFGAAPGATQYVDDLIAMMHDTKPLDPATPVLVAGEPESQAFAERSRTGIPLPWTLIEQLRGICDRRNVDFLLSDGTHSPLSNGDARDRSTRGEL